jgi:Etoposide-induced protein 2.4 (EI24)
MNLLLDSFWRALAYCVLPRVIALSLLPLLLTVALYAAGVYFFWENAIQGLQAWLSEWSLIEGLMHWMESMGFKHLRNVVGPLLMLLLSLPIVILLVLLSVSWLMTPAIVTLVSERRFSQLERQHGGSFWRSVGLGLGSSALAAIALAVTIPLWLIPPLFFILPPLIWGWLTYRVMGYDVLAEHASHEERMALIRRHRASLLLIGVITGYLGAAPGLVFAVGAMAVVMAPLMVPLAIWIYTLVFAFSALWFAHFCLAALTELRDKNKDDSHVSDKRLPA